MGRYNKAFEGGIGAAVAFILVWLVETFVGVEVPDGILFAAATVLAGAFPALGPKNTGA